MNIFKSINEVKQEMNLVSWATKQETLYSTILVIVVSVIFAMYFLVTDSVIYYVIRSLLIK